MQSKNFHCNTNRLQDCFGTCFLDQKEPFTRFFCSFLYKFLGKKFEYSVATVETVTWMTSSLSKFLLILNARHGCLLQDQDCTRFFFGGGGRQWALIVLPLHIFLHFHSSVKLYSKTHFDILRLDITKRCSWLDYKVPIP